MTNEDSTVAPETEATDAPDAPVSTISAIEFDLGDFGKKPAPQMVLKEIIKSEATFIKGTSGCGLFASFTEHGIQHTVEINTQSFRDWLLRRFEEVDGRIAAGKVLDDVSAWCSAQASTIPRHEAKQVFTRVGRLGDTLYFNLGEGRVIEIDDKGWRSCSTPPVLFRETLDEITLPDPVAGGSVDLLRKQMNLSSETDWRLIVTWMVHTFFSNFRGYAVLNFSGLQDVGKSWMQSKILSCLDPAEEVGDDSETGTAYKDLRDFLVACAQHWIIRFGNVSKIAAEQSDVLAIIAQPGYKIVERLLYSNGGAYVRRIHGPSILGGITDYIRRPDLVSRTFFIEVPEIDATAPPFLEEKMTNTFLVERPLIMGALLDCVSHVLKTWSEVQSKCTKKIHRLTDFITVGMALENYFAWGAGSFQAAIVERSDDSQQGTLDSLTYFPLIERLLDSEKTFHGSANELVQALRSKQMDNEWLIAKDALPNAIASQLRRYAHPLKLAGIEIDFGKSNGKRWLSLTKKPYVKPTNVCADSSSTVCPTSDSSSDASHGSPNASGETGSQSLPWQDYQVDFGAGVVDECVADMLGASFNVDEEDEKEEK